MLKDLKRITESCHLNFLIGAGLSCPFLPPLGNIEGVLTALDQTTGLSPEVVSRVRASLYWRYFESVIEPNCRLLADDPASHSVAKEYERFLQLFNTVLLNRRTPLLGKEVNLFTTNVDLFVDKALDRLDLEYNDGFNGRFHPTFSLSHFKKARFKKSLHYDNTAELPVFNLLKLHGSTSWHLRNGAITFSSDLSHVASLRSHCPDASELVAVPDSPTLEDLLADAGAISTPISASVKAFMTAYEEALLVVNPTKAKFHHTLMNHTYYEMLRMFSNELEKESTVLFVLGFSFADEHILEIARRAANSNPTLVIIVIAHTSAAKLQIEQRIRTESVRNANIEVVGPAVNDGGNDLFVFDFASINDRIFVPLLKGITGAPEATMDPNRTT